MALILHVYTYTHPNATMQAKRCSVRKLLDLYNSDLPINLVAFLIDFVRQVTRGHTPLPSFFQLDGATVEGGS